MKKTMWESIAEAITQAQGRAFHYQAHQSVAGGCINDAYLLHAQEGGSYFVKLNEDTGLAMFEAEAEALHAIVESDTIKAPRPLCSGQSGGKAYLVMEALNLGGHGSAVELGEQLAEMHRQQQTQFGWHRDNTIGATHQPNHACDNWIEFWREQRLGFQLELAQSKGYGGSLQRKGEKLLSMLPQILAGHTPVPSLLHGDLWSGNYAYCEDGTAVIFDPATYYGDRETDIAMTELFGGFPADFYAAYENAWPLESGYALRKVLYNLYHILNHLNLFGSGYGAQAESMIDKLLSETA